jgi:hypothetical protein
MRRAGTPRAPRPRDPCGVRQERELRLVCAPPRRHPRLRRCTHDQTRQRPLPNSVVEVRFPAVAGLPAFSIEAGVARHRNVHPRLQAEIQSGIGLEILGRPPAYLALTTRVVSPKSSADGASSLGAGSEELAPRSYRVRLAAHGRSHPRTLTVQATSIQAARARALTQAGAGWKITEVEAI